MKKRGLFLILSVLVAIICGFSFFDLDINESVNAVAFLNSSEVKEDVYDTITINKATTKEDLLKTIKKDRNKSNDDVITASLVEDNSSNELSYEEVVEICEANDYIVMPTSYGYEIYYKFQLKKLIVDNTITNYHNAINVEYCFDNVILQYETEEETQHAYEMFKQQGVNVFADLIVKTSVIDNFSTGNFNSWGADAMDLDSYRSYYSSNGSSKEVVVAVLDTGINTSHELFSGRLLTNGGRIVGYCDDEITTTYTYSGYSFEDDNSHGVNSSGALVATYTGHGSHVSGTICDLTPTNVKILPMKIFNYKGSGSFSDIFEALNAVYSTYSSSYNIVATNLSLGGLFSNTSDAASINAEFDTLFNKLKNDKNILSVVAAGNDSTCTSYVSPGGCGDSAIVVSALKLNNSTYEFDTNYSNYGSNVDISAPGTAIYSATIGTSKYSSAPTEYKYLQGTSMATPHVAAAVALLCLDGNYYNGNIATYTASEIETRLFSISTDLGDSGKDIYYGHGMVNFKYLNGDISYSVTNATVTYDGGYHNISVNVSGVSNYTILYGFTSSSCTISNIRTNSKFKNYTNGAMNVYFKISASNYRDTVGRGTLTINKASVTITTQNQTSVYGNTVNVNQTMYSKTSGTIYGTDDLGVTLSTFATSSSSVGSYDISATATNTNYQLHVVKGKYIITQRPISVSLLMQTFVYGDEIKLDSSAYSITSVNQLVNGDNLNLVLSTNASIGSVVGNYNINYVSANGNYSVVATTGSLKITARPISISSTQAGYYGDDIVLDQTSYSIVSGSVFNGDDIQLRLTTDATKTSSVNTYNIFAECSNSNYEIDVKNSYYSIYRRPITILPLEQSSVYGDSVVLTQSMFEVGGKGLANDDNLNVVLSTTASSADVVGDYVITSNYVEDAVSKNYNITTKTGVLKITKRPISISALEQKSTYGEVINLENSKWTISSGNLVNQDAIEVSLSTSANNKSVVKTYDILVNCSGDDIGNYSITTIKGNLIIEPRDITITILNQEAMFGREISLNNSKFEVTGGSIVNSDNLNVELRTVATSTSPVGEYPITLTYNNANYNVTYIEGILYVKGREVILVLQPQTSIYGEAINLDQSKYSAQEDVSALGISLSVDATSTSPVGEYEIIATSSNSNVFISHEPVMLTILPRAIDIQIENQTCVYGNVLLDQSKYKLGEAVNGDIVDITLTTIATNSSSVNGDYSISAETTNKNYTLNVVAGKLTISPIDLTINIEAQNCEYGNIVLDQTKYVLSSNPINNDELNIELKTDANNVSNVNTYDIYFTYNNENYNVTGNVGVLTILPRRVEIEIKQECVYGETFVLNQEGYKSVSNEVVNGDELNLTLSSTVSSNLTPGSYLIYVVSNNENYEIVVNSATLEITKKPITFIVGNNESVYGENVEVQDTPYTAEGVVEGDDLGIVFVTDATSASLVGDYGLTVLFEGEDAENYLITIVDGTLSITKRPIQLTVLNQQGIYGHKVELEPIYSLTSVLGIVDGDNLNLEAYTEADENSPVGSYDLTILWENPNYDVDVVNGYFIISSGDLAVTILPQTFVYGEEIHLDNLAFVPSINIDKSILGITLTTTAKQYDDAGDNYKIGLECTNSNYDIVWDYGQLTITPRESFITIANQTSEYGNIILTNNQTQYSLTNVVNNDDLGVQLTTNATNTSSANQSYDISYTWTNTNYELKSNNNAKMFVQQRTLMIRTEQQGVYGSNIELDGTIYSIRQGSVVNNDNLGITYTTNAKKYSPVGKYGVNIIYENKNYNISVSTDSFYEITSRPITISIEQKKYYGEEINLNPNDYIVVSGGIVNNDDLGLLLSTDATKTSVVGDYNIELEEYNLNYDITLKSGNLKVYKRILVIETIKSGEYGNYFALDNEFNITQGTIAFATDDLNITFQTDATSISPVGIYNLTMEYDNDNYDIELRSTSHFEVKQRVLKLVLEQQSSEYGNPVQLKQEAYQIVNGNIVYLDGVEITLTTKANETSKVGNYTISCSINNPNYKLDYEHGIYRVEKRKVTVKLRKQNIARGITFEVDQNAYDVVEGSVLEGDNLNIKISTDAKMFSMMGNYKLTATYENANYDVKFINSKMFLNISFIDISVVVIVIGLIIFISVKVVKHKRAKRDNQKLFDKWIKW